MEGGDEGGGLLEVYLQTSSEIVSRTSARLCMGVLELMTVGLQKPYCCQFSRAGRKLLPGSMHACTLHVTMRAQALRQKKNQCQQALRFLAENCIQEALSRGILSLVSAICTVLQHTHGP